MTIREHHPVISGDADNWELWCTCNWYGGLHETEQDAMDTHEDHIASCYET